MNRQQRRAQEALHRQRAKAGALPPARADRRPLYFDVKPGDRVQCVKCLKMPNHAQYGYGEAVINDPSNSPENDGAIYTICVHHLPENAVIFNPGDGTCRNKAGDETWTERA